MLVAPAPVHQLLFVSFPLKEQKKLDLKKLKNLQTPKAFMQILVCTYQKGQKSPS
jgi:hypothetical protein